MFAHRRSQGAPGSLSEIVSSLRLFGRGYLLNLHHYRSPKHPRATIILLHGLGGSTATWKQIARKLPPSARVVAIDLLGFGQSPRPHNATYDARTQAMSVLRTMRRAGLGHNTILVGHSLGALVAVECARRSRFRQLILCSPPFYQPNKRSSVAVSTPDAALMRLYAEMNRNPHRALKLLQFVSRLRIINPGFRVDADNIDAYLSTLTAAIMNQTTYHDARKLRTPTLILAGRFDLLVITANLREIARHNPHVTLRRINAGHEIHGLYTRELIRSINHFLEEK